jgi:hypothetical protein
VDLEDVLPAPEVGAVHHHLPVEPARPQERRVQDVRPVGGGHDDYALGGVEPVHLNQELVQGLLPLVVGAHPGPHGPGAGLPDRVQLVQEHQAGRPVLGLLEELPDAGGTQTHEHLHELRARHEEERHLGLAGHRPGQKGLAAPRRAQQEDALGDPASQALVLLGVLQERHDLPELLDGLVDAGHVGERGLEVLAVVDLDAPLAQVERAGGSPAGHPAEDEAPDGHQDQDGQDPREQERGQVAGLLPGELDVVVVQELVEVGVLDGRPGGGERLTVPELAGHRGIRDGHPGDVAGLDPLDEPGVRDLL